jgi:hypothetical protein
MAYLYEACDQISDFCHQQLLRKMRRKISWTDGRTEVKQYTPFGEQGYKKFVGLSQFFVLTVKKSKIATTIGHDLSYHPMLF